MNSYHLNNRRSLRSSGRLRGSAASFGRVIFAIGVLGGCATAAARPPGAPPTPASVSKDTPGGDADNPHRAALQRLLLEPWARRADKDGQLEVPLSDRANWRRTRFWLLDHFTGFRYGDDNHALNVVLVRPFETGESRTGAECIADIENWAQPHLNDFGVEMDEVRTLAGRWRDRNLIVRVTEASLDYGFGRQHFSVAWTAYPAYPDACTVFGFTVAWDGEELLARKVRDRWVEEGIGGLLPRTKSYPVRK